MNDAPKPIANTFSKNGGGQQYKIDLAHRVCIEAEYADYTRDVKVKGALVVEVDESKNVKYRPPTPS